MNTQHGRWQRLADRLIEAGVPARVDARSYPGGVTRSIGLKLVDGGYLQIADQWWRKNDNVWIGYAVHVEDGESIVVKSWPATKKPAEVVAIVLQERSKP